MEKRGGDQPREAGACPPTVRVVVTCSNRKRLPTPARLRVRTLRARNVAARARTWIARLDGVAAESLIARDLYAGEHWQIARSLADVGREVGLAVEVWIASAGYGLVRWDHPLKPYAATFAPGHPDSVVPDLHPGRAEASGRWWQELSKWPGPQPHLPRSITALAAQHPGDHLVVALSSTYLAALRSDLVEARGSHPDHLLVVSAGTRGVPGLGSSLMPVDASLQIHVGGTRLSLNARVVRWLIQTWPQHHLESAQVSRCLVGFPQEPWQGPQPRTRLTDDEVLEYILREQSTATGSSKTVLLRRLRASGRACEQSRFGVLFANARRDQ